MSFKNIFWGNWPTLFSAFLIILFLPKFVKSGCQLEHLCCVGRNATCKALDQKIVAYWTKNSVKQRIKRTKIHLSTTKKFPLVFIKKWNEKIGYLIMSDLIALNKNGLKYALKFGN